MRLKLKVVLSMMTAFVVAVSSFGMAFANTGGEKIDATSSATSKGYDIDESKVTGHDITIKHSSATYKMRVYVYKYGNVLYYVQDKTTDAPGYLGNIWEEFKVEKGLKKYIGLTFDEVKKMPKPEPKVVMGGTDDTPIEVHNEILKLVGELEKKPEVKAQASKTKLAKLFLSKAYVYAQRDDDVYSQDSMEQFKDAYTAAEAVLKKDNPNTGEIDMALSDLQDAVDVLRAKPLDYTKLKKLIKEGKEILEKENEYSLLSVSHLKQVLGDADSVLGTGAESKDALKALEEKLEKAINNMEKKANQGKIFNIRGKLAKANDPGETSMANGFMNPLITLEEKDGKAIYTIGFKKGGVAGITSEVEYLKHIEKGNEIKAQELPGTGEYNKLFRITRSKTGEDKIDLKIAAKMAGPDVTEVPVLLILDLTSKRGEGETVEKADKTELKALIESEKETFDDVNAGVYKPVGAAEYLKKFDAALKVLEDPDATQESVDKAKRDLLNSKNLDLSLNKDKLAELISKAEEMEKTPEKYTKESFARLQAAVKKANENFYKTDMTKQMLAEYIKDLQNVLDNLNLAGSHFGQILKLGEVTLEGMFTEDTKLVVKKDAEVTLKDEQKKILKEIPMMEKILGVYDVSIENGTMKGKGTLTFSVPKEFNDRDVKVTHFKKDGSVETFGKKVKDGKVTIGVDSFSPFAISLAAKKTENKPEKDAKPEKEKDKNPVGKDSKNGKNAAKASKENKKSDKNSPKTGDEENTVYLVMIILAAVGTLSARKMKLSK